MGHLFRIKNPRSRLREENKSYTNMLNKAKNLRNTRILRTATAQQIEPPDRACALVLAHTWYPFMCSCSYIARAWDAATVTGCT